MSPFRQSPLVDSRRRFLRSATALVALPALESIGFRRFARAAEPPRPPKRMVFLGIGFGVTQETWLPKVDDVGAGYALPEGLAPLARHKADFTLVQGCTHRFASDPHGGSTFWLTGANQYGAAGKSFHNSISVDQVAAAQFGRETRFNSIQLNGSEPNLDGPGHGRGLSLAWDAGGKPVAGFNSPVIAFHRLFSAEEVPLEQRQKMLADEKSVLDDMLEDARSLKRGLNTADGEKLDEYFESLRAIETRLAKEERWLGNPKPKAPLPQPGEGLVGRDEIRLVYDLLVAALQTDSTRVVTFRQPIQHLLTSLGLKVASHDMSHYHPGTRMEASQHRDKVQGELLATLLDALKSTKEHDGSSLFDHTTVVFGSNLRSIHYLDNCPTLIAGRGAGVSLGQHIAMPKDTPLCNVWLTLLRGSGVPAVSFGDSTGVIKELAAPEAG
ncbi:MAG: DUF1552 domain-containing protein [Planctomycetia bacterium]